MSASAPTHRTYVRKPEASQYFEEQPEKGSDHDDSSDDDDSSDSDYDFEDGFLVPDSQVSSDDDEEPAQIEDIAFERARAEAALSEAHKLRRKNESLRRKLKTMTQKKRMWRHRAAIAYRMYHTLAKKDPVPSE